MVGQRIGNSPDYGTLRKPKGAGWAGICMVSCTVTAYLAVQTIYNAIQRNRPGTFTVGVHPYLFDLPGMAWRNRILRRGNGLKEQYLFKLEGLSL